MVENHGALLLRCLNKNEHNFPCFIFPAFRHLYNNLRETTALAYRSETFALALERIKKLKCERVFKTLLPSEAWSTKYKRTFTRLLVFEAFLKLELEKQKNGFYPQTAPSWLPVDPFTGKKLHYCKDDIFIVERIYNPASGSYDLIPSGVDAVAIWSEGEDRQNNYGMGAHERYGRDDIRAMIKL